VEQVGQCLSENVSTTGSKTVPAAFERDVSRLTTEVTKLNERQEVERNALVDQQEALTNLRLQIRMAEEALEHYDGDAKFLRTEPHSALICSTCGAEHGKTFLDLLTYADDARVLCDLLLRLTEDAQEAARLVEQRKAALASLDTDYARVQEVLETRRGDLRLADVVRGIGAEIATLTSNKRSAAILKSFREPFVASSALLNVSGDGARKMRLISRPNVSGSGSPRSMLAYYAAIWHTSVGSHGSVPVPLVVDSPQQQGQDKANLPRMMTFVSSNLPLGAQVILGAETMTKEPFEHVVRLDSQYKLLREKEFEGVRDVIDPLTMPCTKRCRLTFGVRCLRKSFLLSL
jgi:hypothetical protein